MNRFQWLRLIMLFLRNIRITSNLSEAGTPGGESPPKAPPKKRRKVTVPAKGEA